MSDLIAKRGQVLNRHDDALARWPDRAGDGFSRALTAVVDELRALAIALAAGGSAPLECARTWRYVGDALYDLARGQDAPTLQQAVDAYARSERVLDGLDAPLDRAKLDFNLGNTLRGLSDGTQRPLLEEALLHYHLALVTFRRHAPQLVATVQAGLATLMPQLALLDTLAGMEEGHRAATRALEALSGDPDDPLAQERARIAVDDLGARRRRLAADATSTIEDLRLALPGTQADAMAEILQRLQAEGPGNGDDDATPRLFAMLVARFETGVDAGRIEPERRAALERVLDDLRRLVGQPDGDMNDSIDRTGRLRDLMSQMIGLLDEISIRKLPPPPGSRAAQLVRFEKELFRDLASELAVANLGARERQVVTSLFGELAHLRDALPDAEGGVEPLRAHERDRLRPLAQRIADFGLRHHATIARPLWHLPRAPADPSTLYACGAPAVSALVREIADARAFKVSTAASAVEIGQARFNALASSRVVVCDLRLPAGPEFAAACYDIGLAKALGRSVVIVIGPDMTPPFDIETLPVVLEGGANDRDRLADAIDAALYMPVQRAAGSSIAETVSELSRLYADGPGFELRKSVELLQEAAGDPVRARHAIDTLLGFAGPQAPRLLFPAWPGRYPVPKQRRLFHVMPFALDWSGRVRDIVRKACDDSGTTYVRGDEVADPRVIRSIWDEICSASHVLVDLSEFNANVALELGLVHGLGRHALVVLRDDKVRRLFPAIEKTRVLPYRLEDRGDALGREVHRFLSTAPR